MYNLGAKIRIFLDMDKIFAIFSTGNRLHFVGNIMYKGIAKEKRIPCEMRLGWSMGLEPTTFGTTIRRSNQLS